MKYLFYSAVFLIFLLPFVFTKQLSVFGVFIALISCLLLFVASRFDIKIHRSTINSTLFLYFISLLIFLPFSLLLIRSVALTAWIISFVTIFILSQNLINEESRLINISKILVILTTLFGILSLSNFIKIGLTSYTRLEGIIGSHNVYGGFLIIPFLLSIYFLFKENNNWQKRLWYLCSSVILVSLVLTFSRGTWFSIVLAGLISIIFFWRKFVSDLTSFKKAIKPTAILIISSFILFCGVWYIAKQTTINRDPNKPLDTAIYPQQNLEQNAFVARLNYYEDAWNTFLQSPVTGFGAGMYAQSLRIYKTDPSFGSFADPHNWILKNLVENGLIVTSLFTIFIGAFFWQISKMIRKRKEISYLPIFIFIGLLGGTIHGLMDFDWSINQLLIIFFIFAGSLYGYLLNVGDNNQNIIKYFPDWVKYVLLVVIIIFSIISIQILRADLVRARGDVFYAQKDNENALNSYFESVTLNSHEPITWYNLWRVYYSMNKFVPAKNSIQKAIEIFPENGIYWGALARTEEMLGEKENYRESLVKAVKYFPASDLSYYVKLVEHDFEQKKYNEALKYIDKVLPIYSEYEKSLWYKNDPNWPVMSANLVVLRDIKEKIGMLKVKSN